MRCRDRMVSALACGFTLTVGGCTLDLSVGDRDEQFASSMRILLDRGYRIEHVNGVGIVITPPADHTHASTLVVLDHYGGRMCEQPRYSDGASRRSFHRDHRR